MIDRFLERVSDQHMRWYDYITTFIIGLPLFIALVLIGIVIVLALLQGVVGIHNLLVNVFGFRSSDTVIVMAVTFFGIVLSSIIGQAVLSWYYDERQRKRIIKEYEETRAAYKKLVEDTNKLKTDIDTYDKDLEIYRDWTLER